MNGSADVFRDLKQFAVLIVIVAGLTTSAIGARVYPVNASYPENKATHECFFTGENRFYWAYRNCYFVYGNMTGDEFEFPKFYVRQKNYKYALMVYGNDNLTKITFSKQMNLKKEEVFIRANKKLRREMVQDAPFDVDVGSPHDCTMEMALQRTDCTALVGDVQYPGDVDMRMVWSRITKVYGTITVDELWEYDLGYLQNVTVEGWQPRVVRIVNNHNLRYISEVLKMKVSGPEPLFYFRNNTSFCHTVDIIKKIERKVGTTLKWDKKCLKKCAGGRMSAEYLEGIDKFCYIIDGDLIVEELKERVKADGLMSMIGFLPPYWGSNSVDEYPFADGAEHLAARPAYLEKLAQIEKINGKLIVRKNTGIPDLSFLPNLEEILNNNGGGDSLYVAENQNLVVKGLDMIKKIHGNTKVVTEKEGDVEEAFRSRVTRATNGKAVFETTSHKKGSTTTTTTEHSGSTTTEQSAEHSGSTTIEDSTKHTGSYSMHYTLPHWKEIPDTSKSGGEVASGGHYMLWIALGIVLFVMLVVAFVAGISIARIYMNEEEEEDV